MARKINFGSEDEPEYVGTVAADNPWEFFHKGRLGIRANRCPLDGPWAGRWKISLTVIAYAQTLPTE